MLLHIGLYLSDKAWKWYFRSQFQNCWLRGICYNSMTAEAVTIETRVIIIIMIMIIIIIIIKIIIIIINEHTNGDREDVDNENSTNDNNNADLNDDVKKKL